MQSTGFIFQFNFSTTCSYVHWRRYFYRFVHSLSTATISNLTEFQFTLIRLVVRGQHFTRKNDKQPAIENLCNVSSFELSHCWCGFLFRRFFNARNLVYEWHSFDFSLLIPFLLAFRFECLLTRCWRRQQEATEKKAVQFFFLGVLNARTLSSNQLDYR